MTSGQNGSQDIWVGRGGGGVGLGEEGHSSSLKGSHSGQFLLLVITRGLIIDWHISKFQKKGGTWYSSDG